MKIKSILAWVLFGVVVLVAILAIVISTRPADFRISRSITISAPPQIVFAQVNDLSKWNDWSPWAKMDPNAKNTFEGPASGTGAAFAWSGNSKVGEGRMVITGSKSAERIQMRLEFLKPFEAVSTTAFVFKPEGDATVVTWSMFGKNNFMAKAVGLFMDCDKMVGGQFEQGLAQMKSVAETETKK